MNPFVFGFIDELEKVAKTRWVKQWERGKLKPGSVKRIAGRNFEWPTSHAWHGNFPKKLPKQPMDPEGRFYADYREDLVRALRHGGKIRRRGL